MEDKEYRILGYELIEQGDQWCVDPENAPWHPSCLIGQYPTTLIEVVYRRKIP